MKNYNIKTNVPAAAAQRMDEDNAVRVSAEFMNIVYDDKGLKMVYGNPKMTDPGTVAVSTIVSMPPKTLGQMILAFVTMANHFQIPYEPFVPKPADAAPKV